jgi:Family of unknown function (DUF5996)
VTDSASWPELPLAAWRDTLQTLHMWTQIAGKVRMALTPPLNHWWHTTLYVNARGLTTSAVPLSGGVFEIQFDFLAHQLEISTSDGARKSLPLEPQAVATFYDRLMRTLSSMGVAVTINTKPQEVADPIPFDQDYRHASYDPEYAQRFWRILLSTSHVLGEFRGRFLGKCSPVQLFWGSLDLACTRFSGRPAPPRKGVISSEAYSHEVISAGFWPGGAAIAGPAFYSYTAPQPPGLPEEQVRPAGASWNTQLSEFILMYDDVRRAKSPGDALMEFLDSTYAAGAKRANWDRRALERQGTAARTA